MHWQQYEGPWPWRNFFPHEVACPCCGELWPGDAQAFPEWFKNSMDMLQKLRDAWREPIIINSGHRCPAHNEEVGGVPKSQHQKIAFDCRCAKLRQTSLVKLAKQCGFSGIGTYPERGFVHLDCRRIKAQWVA